MVLSVEPPCLATAYQQLKTREMEFCNMQFHMALPVDAIFITIDQLMKLAEYALMPLSSTQAVSLAYVVISKSPSYYRISGHRIVKYPSIALHIGQHESTSQRGTSGSITDLPPRQISLISEDSISPCTQLLILNPPPQLMHHFIQQVQVITLNLLQYYHLHP